MTGNGTFAHSDPLPVLLVRRGAIGVRALMPLHADPRLEIVAVDELTHEWIAFGRECAGVIVATRSDPLNALGYVLTGGTTVPIIVLMAKRYKSEARDLVNVGAARAFTMPVTSRAVDRIVDFFGTHGASTRVDGTLRLLLDPVGRIVRYHDRSVRLSQREFALLHCMSSRHGHPVAAQDLLTYVWGDGGAVERSRQILDVYVFHLRKKLGSLGLDGAISTVRGFGYGLAPVARGVATSVMTMLSAS